MSISLNVLKFFHSLRQALSLAQLVNRTFFYVHRLSSREYDEEKSIKPGQTGDWGITTLPREPGLRVVPHFPQGWLSERNTRVRVKTAGREEKRDAPVTCLRVTFLAGGDFHARSRISHALLPLRKMSDYS